MSWTRILNKEAVEEWNKEVKKNEMHKVQRRNKDWSRIMER